MSIDLVVTYPGALAALKDDALRKLVQFRQGDQDARTGMRGLVPDITILPEPGTASTHRTITWNMNMLVSVSEEGTREKFRRIVGALMRAAGGLGGLVPSASGLSPATARDAVNIAIDTIGEIDDIIDETQADRRIEIDQLKVALQNRPARPVLLKARFAIDARWATDDPDDDDNKGWIEVEKMKIGAGSDFRPNPRDFDANDWDPTDGFPSNSRTGRSFMVPSGPRDRVGAMITQDSSNPTAWLLEAQALVNSDQTTVDTFSTASVLTWNDTVLIEIRRLILYLEVDESVTDRQTAISDTDQAIARFEEQIRATQVFAETSATLEVREYYRNLLINLESQLTALRRYRETLN